MKPKTAILFLVIIFLIAAGFLSYFIFNPETLAQPGMLKPEKKEVVEEKVLTIEEKRQAMLDVLNKMDAQTATKTPEELEKTRQELLETLNKMDEGEKNTQPSEAELELKRQEMLKILNSTN